MMSLARGAGAASHLQRRRGSGGSNFWGALGQIQILVL